MPCACSGVAPIGASSGAPAAPAPEAVAALARGIAAPSNDARIGSSPAGLDPIAPTETDSAAGNTSAEGTPKPKLVGPLNTSEAGSAPAIPVPFARERTGPLTTGLNELLVASVPRGLVASVTLGPEPGAATPAVTLGVAVGARYVWVCTLTREPDAAVRTETPVPATLTVAAAEPVPVRAAVPETDTDNDGRGGTWVDAGTEAGGGRACLAGVATGTGGVGTVILGAEIVVAGTGTVVAGTRTVEAGTGTVVAGTRTVEAGIGTVVAGTRTVEAGTGTVTVVVGTGTVGAGTGTVGAGTGTVGAGTGTGGDTAIEAVVRGVESVDGSEPIPPRTRLSARAVPARPILTKPASASTQPNQRSRTYVVFTAAPLMSA
jgi:hypothetical protein